MGALTSNASMTSAMIHLDGCTHWQCFDDKCNDTLGYDLVNKSDNAAHILVDSKQGMLQRLTQYQSIRHHPEQTCEEGRVADKALSPGGTFPSFVGGDAPESRCQIGAPRVLCMTTDECTAIRGSKPYPSQSDEVHATCCRSGTQKQPRDLQNTAFNV
jgi:hypothetical protein